MEILSKPIMYISPQIPCCQLVSVVPAHMNVLAACRLCRFMESNVRPSFQTFWILHRRTFSTCFTITQPKYDGEPAGASVHQIQAHSRGPDHIPAFTVPCPLSLLQLPSS